MNQGRDRGGGNGRCGTGNLNNSQGSGKNNNSNSQNSACGPPCPHVRFAIGLAILHWIDTIGWAIRIKAIIHQQNLLLWPLQISFLMTIWYKDTDATDHSTSTLAICLSGLPNKGLTRFLSATVHICTFHISGLVLFPHLLLNFTYLICCMFPIFLPI